MRKKLHIYIRLLIIILSFGFAQFVLAQDISLTATVSESNVMLGDRIVYSLEVSGSSQSLPEPQLPDFKGFKAQIINSRSQSINIINGQVTATLTFQALLYPEAEGTFTINPASVNFNGKTYKSNAITVKVSNQPPQDSSPTVIDGQIVISGKTGNAQSDAQLKDKFFLLPVVSNKKPFVGETITVNYYIYNGGFKLASGPSMDQIPEYKNFVKEIIWEPKNWQNSQVKVINGKRFEVYRILGVALIPIKSGKINIDPFNIAMDLQAQRQRRPSGFDPFSDDIFDDFFGRRVEVRLPIAPIELDVQQLPDEGKPINFSGTVGSFTLSSEVDLLKIKQDQVVTLKLTFKGEGDIEGIQEPKFDGLQDFSLYDVQKSVQKSNDGQNITGEKKFEMILKPQKAGQLVIPQIEYPIFNPKTKKYEILRTQSYTIEVEPGEKVSAPLVVSAPAANVPGSQQVKIETTQELNYIKTKIDEYNSEIKLLHHSPKFILFQLLPVIFFVFSIMIRRQRDLSLSDTALVRRRKAKGEAAKRLRQAEAHLKDNNDKFFAELSKALNGFFADHFNHPIAGITHDFIRENLESKIIQPEIINQALTMLEECDAMRYTPAEIGADERKKYLDRAEEIIENLAKELK